MLVLTNQSKGKIKKQEELWSKIRYLIRSLTKNADDYDKKYMRIKLNSDDELPLNKMIEITSMIIIARAVFHESNKYYRQIFLDDCLYQLQTKKKQQFLITNSNEKIKNTIYKTKKF